jgi:hypothetical protein
MANTFWQANFWGVIGTASGVLGLIVSWLNWNYSKPKIQITKLKLETPRVKGYQNITKSNLIKYSIDYNLHIRIRNKKGGPGSIEKPVLIIRFPVGQKFFLAKKYEELLLDPITQHREDTPMGPNSYSSEIIRHGEAWNLGGGGITDDKLRYYLEDKDKEIFFDFIQNIEKVKYYIEYHNNFGKRFRKRILLVEEK